MFGIKQFGPALFVKLTQEDVLHDFIQNIGRRQDNPDNSDNGKAGDDMEGSSEDFSMRATVQAPPNLTLNHLRQKLSELSDELIVDIEAKLLTH